MTAPETASEPAALAVIGAGPWGRNVIKTIQRLEQTSLRAVVSRNAATRDLVAPGVPVIGTYEDLAHLDELQGIFICTPPETHGAVTRFAIEQGWAVMVEKPLTLVAAEANALVDLAQAQEARIGVDHVHLFAPAWTRLKDYLKGETITAITARAGAPRPTRRDANLLWDWGPHDIAMALDLLDGQPEAPSWTIENRTEQGETGQLRFRCGTVPVHITLGTDWPEKVRSFDVITTQSRWSYRDHVADKLIQVTDDGERAIAVDNAFPLDGAVLALARLCSRSSADWEGLALGARVVNIIADSLKGEA